MNHSHAHAPTQWQSQWCTVNLLQQYWWTILTHLYGGLFFFSPDSSQWGPVSQVNSWKLLHIIHHSLVPPAASFYSQNKQIRWLTVSCPPWGTCTPLWRIKSLDMKAASLWPKNIFLGEKKNFPVWQSSSGPLKKKRKRKEWRIHQGESSLKLSALTPDI